MSHALVDQYLSYVSAVRRYSPLTCSRYRDSLDRFFDWLSLSPSEGLLPPRDREICLMAPRQHSPSSGDGRIDVPEKVFMAPRQHSPSSGDDRINVPEKVLMAPRQHSPSSGDDRIDVPEKVFMAPRQHSPSSGDGCIKTGALFNRQTVRAYEVYLLDDRGEGARTVNLHLSILSGFFRYLVKQGLIESNPVRLVPRPKMEKRLPVFFREESMKEYFKSTDYYVSEEFLQVLGQTRDKGEYGRMLSRIIVETLFCTGLRRAELIGLNVSSFDPSRRVLHVLGKGNKMREIPMIDSFCQDISLYLSAVSSLAIVAPSSETPLLVTFEGRRLYPVFVDRVIKKEMECVEGATGRKSPHVLRHTIASELLSDGADLNSIKELLGHSSLAATQVYTHSSIERLQKVYLNAHPRAKNGGKNGD